MPASDSSAPASALSEAKLATPRARAGVIARPRLYAELDRSGDTEFTLVSAPAGSGKTVAVSTWLQQRPDLDPVWITLEEGDHDPRLLWTAICSGVDRLRWGMARPALLRLRQPRIEIESVVDELLNGLATYDGSVVIVLDDAHVLLNGPAAASVGYAMERLPSTTRIVAMTRVDPSVRIARMRARGALAELRARDLAFTVDEATAALAKQGVDTLEERDVELLVARTEGWTTGVGLAALWLAGTAHPREEVLEFSANNRHVADYLTTEVLDSLDRPSREFLVRTSVLERFTAGLCDAVLGSDDSAARLGALEASNLFVVPLDARGEWYRYHHLFRELLLAELTSTDRTAAAGLHSRAAEWFAANDLLEDALAHLEAAGDDAALAQLLNQNTEVLIRSGRMGTLLDWAERVPEPELRQNPVLAIGSAMSAAMLARPAVERRRYATLAEVGLPHLPDAPRLYVEAAVSMTRGMLLDHDLAPNLAEITRAIDLSRAQGDQFVVPTLAVRAYHRYLTGDFAGAREDVGEALARPEAPQRPHGLVFAQSVHTLLELEAGRLHSAEEQGQAAVGLARKLELAGTWSAGIAHHAWGETLLALGEYTRAERELERAVTLRRSPEPRLDLVHSQIQLARARVVLGRLALAASELALAREQLTAFTDAGRLPQLADEVEAAIAESAAGAPIVAVPLTPAELAILPLLGSDLSQREIGEQLYLSVNTVKTHSRSLYAKLGAHSREEAVRNANALGLIAASS